MNTFVICFLIAILPITVYGQKGGFVESDSAKTFYGTFGTGKPLLIINGGPGMNSDGFVSLARILSKDNQAIIYDQRGIGKSSLTKVDSTAVTMKSMVEDMERLRIHLGIQRWTILGHSFGGMLASYYATLHPENIDALILSSSGGVIWNCSPMQGEILTQD